VRRALKDVRVDLLEAGCCWRWGLIVYVKMEYVQVDLGVGQCWREGPIANSADVRRVVKDVQVEFEVGHY